MAKQQSVSARGMGFELQRLRTERGMTCAQVGAAIGVSASTISRIETGRRPASSEDVASILTALKITGVERERLMEQSHRQNDPELVETTTEQSRSFRHFETRAISITNFELFLMPGLAQTPDYARAVIAATQIDATDKVIEERVGRRMARQAILVRRDPPKLHWIVTELGLRQPIGGRPTMARQVRQLADFATRPNITINVIPASVVEHPGLMGSFVTFEFTGDPTIVFVEDRTTGLFLDDPDKVDLYRLTVEKLTAAAADSRESIDLMRSVAEDLEHE